MLTGTESEQEAHGKQEGAIFHSPLSIPQRQSFTWSQLVKVDHLQSSGPSITKEISKGRLTAERQKMAHSDIMNEGHFFSSGLSS